MRETIEIGKREPRIRAAELRLEAERRRSASLLGAKAKEARDALGREICLRERIAELEVNLDVARQLLALEEKRRASGPLGVGRAALAPGVRSALRRWSGARAGCAVHSASAERRSRRANGPLWYALPPRRWTSSRSSSAPPATSTTASRPSSRR